MSIRQIKKKQKPTYITISFSYAYLNGFERFIVSSPCVQIRVHRPRRAISPRMTDLDVSKVEIWQSTIGTLTVHKHSLRNIVRIVSRNDVIYI